MATQDAVVTIQVIVCGSRDGHYRSSFNGIYISCMQSPIMLRRMNTAIQQVKGNASITPEELHTILKSFVPGFSKVCDISEGQRIEFICIMLSNELLSLMQTIYPPTDRISYDIIKSVEDAMYKYENYLDIASPGSSATRYRHYDQHLFDSISRIPLNNGNVIYLCGYAGAKNIEELRTRGITHILNVTKDIDNHHATCNFTYMRVPINDEYVEITPYFIQVFKFINDAYASGGHILVHCAAGISRSASFVIAYLMHSYRLTYDSAFKHVKTHRSVIIPNMWFEMQLREYEAETTINMPDI